MRESLEDASQAKKVENAFLIDLQAQFPQLRYEKELKSIADGIQARTIRHSKRIEGKTGGDFGLLVIRPSVTVTYDTRRTISRFETNIRIRIHKEYCCGLLCQAKLGGCSSQNRRNKWGKLTQNQKRVIPERIDYLSLILYEYLDEERYNLDSFHWQLCKGANIEDIEDWLKSGNFPNKDTSDGIIEQLCSGNIGTDQLEIINNYISPKMKKSFVIKVGWAPGKEPPDYFSPQSRQYIDQRTRTENIARINRRY